MKEDLLIWRVILSFFIVFLELGFGIIFYLGALYLLALSIYPAILSASIEVRLLAGIGCLAFIAVIYLRHIFVGIVRISTINDEAKEVIRKVSLIEIEIQDLHRTIQGRKEG